MYKSFALKATKYTVTWVVVIISTSIKQKCFSQIMQLLVLFKVGIIWKFPLAWDNWIFGLKSSCDILLLLCSWSYVLFYNSVCLWTILLLYSNSKVSLFSCKCVSFYNFTLFTDSAHWADSVIDSQYPCVCLSVHANKTICLCQPFAGFLVNK